MDISYYQRVKSIFQYTLDQGRQRSYKLVAKKYEGMIAATDQLEVEKSKMQELKVNNHYRNWWALHRGRQIIPPYIQIVPNIGLLISIKYILLNLDWKGSN